jgi:hypothetical protein
MKTNELRIGNYLKGKQGHVIVSEIRTNNSVKIHDNTSSFSVGICLIPIPLTEEWLLKFGFEDIGLNMSCSNWLVKEQKGIWRQAIRIAYNERSEEWSLTLECVSPPTLSIATIKYVHQLQNLYFALTGKELIIEL